MIRMMNIREDPLLMLLPRRRGRMQVEASKYRRAGWKRRGERKAIGRTANRTSNKG